MRVAGAVVTNDRRLPDLPGLLVVCVSKLARDGGREAKTA